MSQPKRVGHRDGMALRFTLSCAGFLLIAACYLLALPNHRQGYYGGYPTLTLFEAYFAPLLFWLLGLAWTLRVMSLRVAETGRLRLAAILGTALGMATLMYLGAFIAWLLIRLLSPSGGLIPR